MNETTIARTLQAFRNAAALLALALPFASAGAGQEAEFALEPGVNRPGFDYAQSPAVSLEECQARCAADPRCRTFVYAAPPDFRAGCYLKEVVPDPVPDGACTTGTRREEPEVAEKKASKPGKGPVPTPTPPRFRHERGVNRPGNDYQHLKSVTTLEACEARCLGDKRCKAFVFVVKTDPLRGCYLKDKVMPVVKDKACVSGIRLR